MKAKQTIRSGAIVSNCMYVGLKDRLTHSINKPTPCEGVSLRICDPKELEGFRKINLFIP